MHENISITDGIYGGLSDADIKEQIMSLTENITTEELSKEDIKRIGNYLLEKFDLQKPK